MMSKSYWHNDIDGYKLEMPRNPGLGAQLQVSTCASFDGHEVNSDVWVSYRLISSPSKELLYGFFIPGQLKPKYRGTWKLRSLEALEPSEVQITKLKPWHLDSNLSILEC
jgi:hypothetical protein